MKERVRTRAHELGFDDCRFAAAAPADTAPQFLDWLAHARHGEMAYLQRNSAKRADPQLVLPGAKTIVTVAVNYAPAEAQRPGARGEARVTGGASSSESLVQGFIARYARFDDYHHVIAERLERLARYLTELGGSGSRSIWYVDTGPILERDFAQRSGIGFVGKHTNVISRRFGNWILLGEVLTTLTFEPDAPERNRCGICSRCLEACPTGAIVEPFQLDARLCISYLTIEYRGSIPVELRRKIGNRIFGCDDCLAVCPWNRFARDAGLMKDYSRGELTTPDLAGLLRLDDAAFKARFAGTPILRAKRSGFLRNVCVALGNVGDRSVMPALERAASDADPLVAEHARWAVEEIRSRWGFA